MSKEPTGNAGLEFAWRVHNALDSWTGKVDTKASITLAIETAILGFIVSLSSRDGPLTALRGNDLWLFRIGISLVSVSILLALSVVVPQLNRRQAKKDWEDNMIYFGHLRHWDVDKLVAALFNADIHPRQLARQLIQMSRIAWRKHVWLQWSLGALVVGASFIAAAGF